MTRRPPTGTYRLQLHEGFGFADAARVLPYLSRLGVSHLYLSPILQAAPGSMHGYDVVDHAQVSADLGGEPALVALADAAHAHDLGIVVDVVPNHMAIPTPAHLNRRLWDVLRDGPESPKAHWFDVEWTRCQGRLALPVLDRPLDEAVASGALTVGRHAGLPVLRVSEQVLPLAAGTEDLDMGDLVQAQHYLLGDWHQKAELLNYRRFFDVDTLIAIRVELDDVFDATHAVLLDLYRDGVIDGFRIDHPDGLADPRGYLERLAAATDGAWVVVEKILEPGERLPVGWPCAGSTGYDAIRAVQAALLPDPLDGLAERWRRIGGEPSYPDAELVAKDVAIATLLQPEVERLVRLIVDVADDRGNPIDEAAARAAVCAILRQIEVYRIYLRPGEPADREATERFSALLARACDAEPGLALAIAHVVGLVSDTDAAKPAARDLVVRFQQVCGPVMAKGVEDTVFYRWHRLVALNEVGGDPAQTEPPGPDALHGWAEEQAHSQPSGLVCLTTHDTKRSGDARARLLALAEDLDGWDAWWSRVRPIVDDVGLDQPTGYLLFQTLAAAWPIDAQRLDAYLVKAAREAKLHSSWTAVDEEYEARLLSAGRRCLESPAVRDAAEAWLSGADDAVAAVTLSSALLQLTLPGIPDVYQGTEAVSRTLVDPDNRRPVDYQRLASLLEDLDERHGTPLPRHLEQDRDAALSRQKLWITSRVLRLRRSRPDLFGPAADYRRLKTAAPFVIGFVRGGRAATLVTRRPVGARSAEASDVGGLPAGDWTDVLTGRTHRVGDTISVSEALADLPVALLVKEEL